LPACAVVHASDGEVTVTQQQRGSSNTAAVVS